MNKSKFPWAIVVTIFLAVFFGIVCFLGANFLNINDEKVWGMSHTFGCVVIASVIAILLGGTASIAILLKRTSGNFKTCFIFEVIFLLLFVVLALFFTTRTSPFPHYFTVMTHKDKIKINIEKSITQAEKMFEAYESYADNRENLYKNKLKSAVAAKSINPNEYAEYGFENNNIQYSKQIETKIFTVHADLFPTNYSDTIANNGIKEVATEWLQDAKSITNSPLLIGIAGVVNDIEKQSNEWLNTLVTFSQIREQGEQATDFEYPLDFEDVKNDFTKLSTPTTLAISLAVLVYALILLSYIFTVRSTKSTYGFRALLRAVFSKKHKKAGSDFDIEY